MTRFFDDNNEDIMWARKMLGVKDPSSMRMPETFVPFFGQSSLKIQVGPFLTRPVMPPILLTGEPGMGKNQFVEWVASQRQEPIDELMCPIKPGTALAQHGIVLLDEAHLLKKPEWLFRRMESREGASIIAATTRPELLDPAFKSRFFVQLHLKPYRIEDMKQLIAHYIPEASEESVEIYAGGSAGNPRQAMRIVETAEIIGVDQVEEVMRACRITADGINEFQMRYLMVLSETPVGLDQVSLLMYADKETIRMSERFLIHAGLVELGPTGRKLTREGQRYVSFFKEEA